MSEPTETVTDPNEREDCTVTDASVTDPNETADNESADNEPDANEPDFAKLAAKPAGRYFLADLWAAHCTYVDSFDKVYPNVDKLPRQRAWQDSLPTVGTVQVPNVGTGPDDWALLNLSDASIVANESADAPTVATLVRHLSRIVEAAQRNLDGLYVHAKSTRTPTVETADAASVEAARLELNAQLKLVPQMASLGYFTVEAVWSILPSVTTDGGKVKYGGPSLPTSRKVNVLRSNTKRLAIIVGDKEVGSNERDLASNVKEVLRLTMSELRALVGDFTADNYGTNFTSPANGLVFSLQLRADAPDESADDNESDENEPTADGTADDNESDE